MSEMLENKHSLENHAICTNIPMFVLKTKTLIFVFLSGKKMQICKLSKLDVDRLRSACHFQAWRLTVSVLSKCSPKRSSVMTPFVRVITFSEFSIKYSVPFEVVPLMEVLSSQCLHIFTDH